MAPLTARNRASEFDDLLEPSAIEFDPETDDQPIDSEEEEEDESAPEGLPDESRTHYEDVGKSKLRKPKEASLGPQYRGSRVSRDALSDDEDADDPFSKGFDDDESDDEDVLGGATEGSLDGDSEESEFGTSDNEMEQAPARDEDVKAKLQDMFRNEQSAIAASLSEANKAEADKGRAVKRQRAAYDSLLGTRMKLQKALVGVNTLTDTAQDTMNDQRKDAASAFEAAEAAAFKLWSTLNDYREEVAASKLGQKRKRQTFTSSASTDELWEHMQAQEGNSVETRNAVLQKWSIKSRGMSAVAPRGQLSASKPEATLIEVLQEQLSGTRLLKRAYTPRSCAPLQVANNVMEDDKIYDDADFYGLMLKELLEQKSVDSISTSNIDVSFQMRREAKTRKNVDTKASKGRKLRYTVHEKLQNYMASEDRSQWGDRQTDELFGSLFGQRSGLGEEKSDDEEIDVGETALMLFRK